MCRNVKLALILELSQPDRGAQSTLGAPLKAINEGEERNLTKKEQIIQKGAMKMLTRKSFHK